ncbi:Phospholipase/carboxylesterase [Auriculariales sp. MPI-PUGE-AT-0066]|nr:Phospholipase/carboxylesterase [Auriculariales sp. MPI-PUGE-AT-0066]
MSSATSAKPLTFHTVQPKSQHTATIIFVHGLGDSGEGWLPVAKQLSKSDALSHVKWILPNAPERSISVNMGMKMPGWYDIYSFAKDELSGETRREDKKGMLESRDSIVAIVKQEIEAGIPEDRVVVGGFSQGETCLTSLAVGITGPYKLAGIAVASGYMPLPLEIKDLANPHAAALPVWWAHGTRDPLIPYDSVDKSMSIARARLGMSNAQPGSTAGIEFHSYNIAHSADQAEIISLGQWVARVVPAK